MARLPIWKAISFKSMKVKLGENTFDRYKMYLASKKKTIQQDIEEYVVRTIS